MLNKIGHVSIMVALAQIPLAVAQTRPPAQMDPVQPPMVPSQQVNKNDPKAAIESLTQTAENFKDTVIEVGKMLQDTSQSREKGAQALDKMLAALHNVQSSVGDQGQIWQQYSTMVTEFQRNQKKAEESAIQDPAFQAQADEWGRKVHEAADLRTSITHERNRVEGMIADVEHNREIVLGWYSLGQADKALAGLQKINEQLGKMNNDLSNMLQQAKRVGPGV